jgi:hypothetical protein
MQSHVCLIKEPTIRIKAREMSRINNVVNVELHESAEYI